MPVAEKRDAAQLERELATLRDGAALAPLSERAILIARGMDRTSFLQGMLSNDVVGLAPGQGAHALLLTEQGRVVAELCVLACADATWLELPAAARERARAALERFVVADDVEFEEAAMSGVALHGAGAVAALGKVLPQRAAEIAALGEAAHLDAQHGGGTVHVARVREWGGDGFHVWSGDAGRTDGFAVALLGAGAVAVGPEVLEIQRIAAGWARDGADYDAQTLAAEIPSFARAVSYRKGCYLGQEVMERIAARGHVNWLLVRLTGEPGSSFTVGAPVGDGVNEVGRVTSVAILPGEEKAIGLARVRAAVAQSGRRLAVLDDGRESAVEVTSIPVDT